MGFVEDNSSKSGVVELNLVPFIDLMSVCIIFLLITAVWTQVSMIQLGTSLYSKKVGDDNIEPAPQPYGDIPFRVDIRTGGYQILVGAEKTTIPLKQPGVYDHQKLVQQIEKVKSVYPDKIDVVVTSQNDLMYKHLVMAMDLLLASGFSGISVATAEVL